MSTPTTDGEKTASVLLTSDRDYFAWARESMGGHALKDVMGRYKPIQYPCLVVSIKVNVGTEAGRPMSIFLYEGDVEPLTTYLGVPS